VVLKPVGLPAPHAYRLAVADVDRFVGDRPSRGALEPVDRLLEAVMAVGHGHPGVGWDMAREDRRTLLGLHRRRRR
jgi:hypothetical protein